MPTRRGRPEVGASGGVLASACPSTCHRADVARRWHGLHVGGRPRLAGGDVARGLARGPLRPRVGSVVRRAGRGHARQGARQLQEARARMAPRDQLEGQEQGALGRPRPHVLRRPEPSEGTRRLHARATSRRRTRRSFARWADPRAHHRQADGVRAVDAQGDEAVRSDWQRALGRCAAANAVELVPAGRRARRTVWTHRLHHRLRLVLHVWANPRLELRAVVGPKREIHHSRLRVRDQGHAGVVKDRRHFVRLVTQSCEVGRRLLHKDGLRRRPAAAGLSFPEGRGIGARRSSASGSCSHTCSMFT